MRNTLLMLGILALLILGYFLFVFEQGSSSLSIDDSNFAISDTSAIQRITLRAVKEDIDLTSVVLERDPAGGWILNGRHRAVEPRVNTLLETLHLIQVRGTISEAGKKKALQLIDQRHIQVEVYGEGGSLKSYKVGPQTKDAKGTVMLMEGSESPHIVAYPGLDGYVNSRYSLEYDLWRENLLFDARPDQLNRIQVDYLNSEESFVLQKQSDEWTLAGVELALNEATLEEYLALFKGKVYGESFAEERNPNKIDTLRQVSPDIRFGLGYEDGQDREILLFSRPDNGNNYFGWVKGEEELLTIQLFVFDPFLVKKSSFVEN